MLYENGAPDCECGCNNCNCWCRPFCRYVGNCTEWQYCGCITDNAAYRAVECEGCFYAFKKSAKKYKLKRLRAIRKIRRQLQKSRELLPETVTSNDSAASNASVLI
jgi:hypothetical protein